MNRDWLRALLGDRPRFDIGAVLISGPARQLFMTAAMHSLKRRGVTAPRIIEIGSWIGNSTFTWAESIARYFGGCGTIVCIDPWEDYEIVNRIHGANLVDNYRTMLTTGLTYDLFMHNISYLGKDTIVQPLRGRSDQLLPLLREQAFDLVYIDGDHAYDSVCQDIKMSRELVKPGGILCGDDLDLDYTQCDAEHVRANRDAQPAVDPKSGRVFHPGVTLAVHELIGRVANYAGFWGVALEDGGLVPLDLSGERCFIPGHIDASQSASVLKELRARGLAS